MSKFNKKERNKEKKCEISLNENKTKTSRSIHLLEVLDLLPVMPNQVVKFSSIP